MRVTKFLVVASVAAFAAACSDSSTPTTALDPNTLDQAADFSLGLTPENAGKLKLHPTVQQAAHRQSIQAGPPILYHAGGRVIPQPKVSVIYWSNGVIYGGGPAAGTSGPGSADGSVIGLFLRNVGGTPFWSINHEYTDAVGRGHKVGNNVTYSNFYANNVGAPTSGQTITDAQVQTMLGSVVGSAQMPWNQQTIYVVLTGAGVIANPGFGTQFCGYHSYFPRPGHPGQYIIYSLDGRDADWVGSCTAVNTPATNSPNNDFAADAELNVLSHEVEEAATDPGLNAWFDGFGYENADKCAWTWGTLFAAPNGSSANVTFNGNNFLIQRNWRIGAVPPPPSQFGCSLN